MTAEVGKTTYLLTGDIGGTNSRMSLYAACSSCDRDEPLFVKTYRNAEHLPASVLKDPTAFSSKIIVPFLQYCWEEDKKQKEQLIQLSECQIVGCFAIAGVVTNNAVRLTNLGNMLVDGNAIRDETSNPYLRAIVSCTIINDFVAQGYGCLTLHPNEVQVLAGPGKPADVTSLRGPKVCVGAGTGLGECYLTPNDDGDVVSSYTCFPSEGGHCEYAPRTDEEIDLWRALKKKFNSNHRISVERIVSGIGLANVYEYLSTKHPDKVDKKVHDEFVKAGDEQGRIVAVNAVAGSLCERAMNIFAAAYGTEVSCAAVKWIPTGGLFVTGGLTPKNMKFLAGEHSEFIKAYHDKGRVKPALDRVTVFAVLVEDLGVRGAHKAALVEYERHVLDPEKKRDHVKSTFSILSSILAADSGVPTWLFATVTAVAGFSIGLAVASSGGRRL